MLWGEQLGGVQSWSVFDGDGQKITAFTGSRIPVFQSVEGLSL